MVEIRKLGEKTYCIVGVVNIGIYLINDKDICIIDSGSDESYGKKVVKVLNDHDWSLKYIINTHSHADHIGGNSYLQKKYNCPIYCSEKEAYFINNPIFEPALLYGASPINSLKNKFLLAKESNCEDISNLRVDGLEIISLEGHSIDMIGILTSDNVLFCGDSFTSKKIIEKYQIQYIYDIDNYMATLDKLKLMECKFYVPSHGDIEDNISNTILVNINNCLKIKEVILKILEVPCKFDDLLKEIFIYYHISMNEIQYYLIGTTIKSFLTVLNNEGLIEFIIDDYFHIIKKII